MPRANRHYPRLMALLQIRDIDDLQESCKNRVDEAIKEMDHTRDSKWTESIAVGNERFIAATKELLRIKAKGRKIIGSEKGYELREPAASYSNHFATENGLLRPQNAYYWSDYNVIPR